MPFNKLYFGNGLVTLILKKKKYGYDIEARK